MRRGFKPIPNTKVRIFVDAHMFDGPYQGSTTFIKGIYNEVLKRYKNVNLILGAKNIENLKSEFGLSENVSYVKYLSGGRLRYVWDIPRILEKLKPDYAHFTYVAPPKVKDVKYIVTIHDLLFNDFPEEFSWVYRIMRNGAFRKSANIATILTTLTDYSRESLIKHYKIRKDKIFIVPCGVNKTYYEKCKINILRRDLKNKYGLEKYILYISRVEPRKNHETLLQAYMDLRLWEKGIKLVFVGKYSIVNKKLDAMLKSISAKTKANILFIEQCSPVDLKNLYKGAELFVYPSRAEGFGIPPLEACASGVTTLCSNTTGMADYKFLKQGLFNPFSIEELKDKIGKALKNKLVTRRDKVQMAEYIKNRYSWESAANKLMTAIDSHE